MKIMFVNELMKHISEDDVGKIIENYLNIYEQIIKKLHEIKNDKCTYNYEECMDVLYENSKDVLSDILKTMEKNEELIKKIDEIKEKLKSETLQ